MEAIFTPGEADLSDIVARLRARAPLPALFPPKPWAPWNADIHQALTGDPPLAWPGGAALRAGLLLWNDALDASHTVSQGIDNPTGAYWHGIMHRREGDLDNAGYWMRRVGRHPVFEDLYPLALGLLDGPRRGELERAGRWDALRFLDWCGAAGNGDPVLERIQVAETELLLRHCYTRDGG